MPSNHTHTHTRSEDADPQQTDVELRLWILTDDGMEGAYPETGYKVQVYIIALPRRATIIAPRGRCFRPEAQPRV